MGSTDQSFVLRWNDFHSNITTSFKNLRDCDEFFDVTISVDEDHQVLAHKVILAACSPYFRAMLKKNPAKHPVLIMPGSVRYQEICPMIDFMYHGEVSIPNEDLTQFLKTAEQFKVKGLTEERSKQNANNQRLGKMPPVQPRPGPQPGAPPPGIQSRLPPGIQMVKRPLSGHSPSAGKRPRMSQPSPVGIRPPGPDFPVEPEDEEDEITEIREGDSSNDFIDGYEDQYDDGAIYEEGQGANQATSSPAGGPQLMGLLCPNCRSMCQGVKALKDHMVVCQAGGGGAAGPSQPAYPPANAPVEDPQSCDICDKSFKSHRTLENHMKKQHKINPPPKPHTPKGPRGRPKKSAAMDGEGEGWQAEQQYQGAYQETPQMPKQPGELNRRPVGQVAPAQRTIRQGQSPTPVKEKGEVGGPPSMGRGMASPRGRGRGGPMGRGAPRPGPSREGAPGAPPGARSDLQKLGLKFGGQISITSSGNLGKGGPGGGEGDGKGVSITKLKGDVPVSAPMPIRDATARPGRRVAPQGPGGANTPRSQSRDAPVEIKEEPTNLFEEGAEEVEDPDMQGDYFEEYEGEYEGDGMYEEEYEEGGEEGDDSFNGRSGMFQGGFEGGYEEDPDMEGTYEEEG